MELKKNYHGFTLVKKEKVTSIASEVHLFRHNKTGAELLYVKNKDPELMYTVGFRTPADDDTGKSHIFEHATMMSSEKYPVRDIFIALYKGAHTSFLNAMTFPDKTVYPVGSTNKEEFKKLVDVYTDTTLKPLIYKNENIFLQEGVRFELDKKDKLSVNGVVFNEMKGALSSPDRQLEEQAMNKLFPDNTYQYCSGGLPEVIPTLKHKDLLAYHRKCYHPSNAHFFFYGDLSIKDYLKYLDDDYLSNYKRQKPLVVKKQKTKKLKSTTDLYTSTSAYEQYSLGFKLDDNKKETTRIASELLFELLMGDSHAPLKKALLSSGIAQDYDYIYEDEIQDLFVLFVARNAEKGKSKEFNKVITKTLSQLVRDGIDQSSVDKVLERYELLLRSAQDMTTRGLHLYRIAETAWLYGGDPIKRLSEAEIFDKQKGIFTPKFFEKMITRILINNEHSALYVLKPTKKDLQKESIEKLLAKETRALTKEKKQIIRDQMRSFSDWQKDEKQPSLDAFFPTLSLDQIPDSEVYELNAEVVKKNGTTYLWAKSPKQALEYVSFRFDISHISYKDVPYVEIISKVIAESATEKYTSQEVSDLLARDSLGFGFGVDGFEDKTGDSKVHLRMSFQALSKKKVKLLSVINSLLNDSLLDTEKIKEILAREITRMESAVVGMESRNIVQTRTSAKLYSHVVYEEYSGGISYLQELQKIQLAFKKDESQVIKKLQKVYSLLFTTKGAYVSGLTRKNDLAETMIKLGIDNHLYSSKKVSTLPKRDEFFQSASMSNYNSIGIRTKKQSTSDKATRSLLAAILNPNYLWKNLRDKGGAYGGALMPSPYDDLTFISWRDPRVSGTYKDFKNVVEYVAGENITVEDLHQAKISLFSKLDSPVTRSQLLEKETARLITGRTKKGAQQKRKKLKDMSPKNLSKTAGSLLSGIARGVKTTVGRSDVDSKTKKEFKSVEKI